MLMKISAAINWQLYARPGMAARNKSPVEPVESGPKPRQETLARPGVPRVGEVLRRLRLQNRMSLREVAEASGLSVSFLGSVERGESDIAVGRLAQVAEVFSHDVASLLGYTLRQTQPRVLQADERVVVPRGRGVEFTAMRIPGTTVEFMTATLAPRTRFDDVVTHAGIDVLFVVDGSIVLVFDEVDYAVGEAQCVVWPSSHPHSIRNDTDSTVRIVGFTSETVY
jgi:transcriptional regulator with XRE-family HTH domain